MPYDQTSYGKISHAKIVKAKFKVMDFGGECESEFGGEFTWGWMVQEVSSLKVEKS